MKSKIYQICSIRIGLVSLLISIVIISFSGLLAQEKELPELTLENIYTKRAFSGKRFGPARFLENGRGYTTLERSETVKGRDIVWYKSKTGEREVLIPAEKLVPSGEENPLSIRDYQWSDDGTKLLIFTNTRRVWRRHTRGDYWALDLDNWQLQQLGKSVPATTMMFAKFSPDGKKVGFVSEQNIFMENLETGEIKQLTTDGSGHTINGTFDWVYEEELSCRDGFRWSPDSKYIAYWQLDTEGINIFHMINNIDSLYPELIPIPYPKVGTTNPAAKIGVISAEGGKTRWFDIPGDPRNHYLARMDFADNNNEVIIQQLNRMQNANKVMLADIHTGELNTILTETDEAWVDIHDNLQWMDDGKYFTWSSERDGWHHLYLISLDGKIVNLITKGNFDIIRLVRIDEKSGYVYYLASPDNPTQSYLYRSKLDGSVEPKRITPLDQPGHHRYQMSPDTKWAIHTYENHNTPAFNEFISLPDHKSLRVLEDNKELKEKYENLGLRPKEFFMVTIEDSVELYCWMIKPINFDAKKKYPVIFNIYGEPAGSTVQDRWGGGDLFNQYMAQQGYIIMSVDNRGTRMPRGRDWRKIIYKQIGILASFDQKAAAKAIIKRFDFVDGERIGVWGWSGGGSMSLNCIFRFPEIYKTAVAIAFISNQRFYDTIYQERYMGLPADNEEGYREGSPVTHAYNLQGNLLMIYGSGDDNCHYQNCEVLVNELIKHNKMFSMMEYPMRSHGIGERENTSRHLRETIAKYFLDHLPPGGK